MTQKNASAEALVRVECPARMSQTHPLTTTAFELEAHKVVNSFSVVRCMFVRWRSSIGEIGAGFQSLLGGNTSLCTSVCERTREDVFLN